MADTMFLFARRAMVAHNHDGIEASARKLLVEEPGINETMFRMRATGALRLNRKNKSIRRVVRCGDMGYLWPTRFSDVMADVKLRRFSVA